jgi:hypothetical protein
MPRGRKKQPKESDSEEENEISETGSIDNESDPKEEKSPVESEDSKNDQEGSEDKNDQEVAPLEEEEGSDVKEETEKATKEEDQQKNEDENGENGDVSSLSPKQIQSQEMAKIKELKASRKRALDDLRKQQNTMINQDKVHTEGIVLIFEGANCPRSSQIFNGADRNF